MSQPITIHVTPARDHLQVCSDPQLVYLLLTARTQSSPQRRMPLNVCLVIDRSSSMRGDRLFQVKEAARQVASHLEATDAFGLVTFNDRAEVIVPSQPVRDISAINNAIASIEARGGTEMAQGLTLGLQEIERPRIAGLNRIVLLTDGRTYGDESTCVELVRRAQRRGIGLTALGVGTEWNEDLLETMTAGANSRTTYIANSSEIVSVFASELNRLHSTIAQSAELAIAVHPETQIRSCFQVQPFIAQLHPQGGDRGQWRVPLGEWSASEEQTFAVELLIPPLTAGNHPVARFDLRYEMIGATPGQVASSAMVQMPAAVGGSQDIVPQVRRALERVTAFQLQSRAWRSVAEGRIDDATQRLRTASTHLFSAGEMALAETIHAEATRLLQSGAASADGRKRIKYGTRGLVAGA